jgi:transcriptional regulator with XRE-family HTH domain
MATGRPPGSTGTGSTPRVAAGLIAGVMLRTIRESIHLTQEQLAEALVVDPNTVKGWETGRRPLINASGRTLFGLRRQLLSLGASADLVGHLSTAMDADLFVAQVLDGDTSQIPALLGSWVATRVWTDLIAWAFSDAPPMLLRGHLKTIPRSALPTLDRRRFFAALRAAAERSQSDNPGAMLLRRQIYYMAAWDPSPDGRDWLASMERRELRQLRRSNGWSPVWPLLRSTAVARACQGDPTLLRDFVTDHLLEDDVCEAANLNYWSYWVEETTGTAISDDFMAGGLGPWRGAVLLNHLTDGISEDLPYLSLSVHAVASLVQRRPSLLLDDPQLAGRLRGRVTGLLESGSELPRQARRDLENITYAASMAAAPARRPHA